MKCNFDMDKQTRVVDRWRDNEIDKTIRYRLTRLTYRTYCTQMGHRKMQRQNNRQTNRQPDVRWVELWT